MRTRREVLVLLGAEFVFAPFTILAQTQSKVWRVGVLAQRARPASLESAQFSQIPRGLRVMGYVEGKNLTIEWRFANGKYERLPELAAELVQLPVDVIVTADGTPSALAAQKATRTIPIVFIAVGDPVGSGLVKALARPGGNITGFTVLSSDTAAKQLEMLIGMTPRLSHVAVLQNPSNPASLQLLKGVQAAASISRVEVLSVGARTPKEIEDVFSVLSHDRPSALIVAQDSFLFQQGHQIAELAEKIRLPSIGGYAEYVEAGGLMSYGANRADIYWRAAIYVDKIFRGANPGELPVEQPTKFELVLNRKTAKALGIEFPPEILLLADKVIE